MIATCESIRAVDALVALQRPRLALKGPMTRGGWMAKRSNPFASPLTLPLSFTLPSALPHSFSSAPSFHVFPPHHFWKRRRRFWKRRGSWKASHPHSSTLLSLILPSKRRPREAVLPFTPFLSDSSPLLLYLPLVQFQVASRAHCAHCVALGFVCVFVCLCVCLYQKVFVFH